MAGQSEDSDTPLVEPLTRRERQVLALLAEGYSGPEIAEKLTLALSSVKTHIQNVYGKLGANSKRQAITRATELGLLGAAPALAAGPAVSNEPAEAAPEPGTSPFKGLRYFDEPDAALFFGREALVARLVARLAGMLGGAGRRPARFLAVVGASGSGKSSVVRAGVIPALRQAHGAGPYFNPIHILTPTAHPLESLAASLTHAAESVTATATLMDDLARDERALHLHLRRLSYAGGLPRSLGAPPAGQPLLVIDQFEELFTLCRSEAGRLAFINNLILAAAPDAEGAATILITLRADFYSACAPYPALRDLLASQQEYIGPMSAEELRQAIELPASQGRWGFAPGLVELILRDVGGEPGALPLLSHALLETWRHRRGRTLTLESYAEAGRVEGAIATTAETVFQALTPEEQALARSVFLRLTELGEGTQDTRRRVAIAEFMPPGAAGSAPAAAMATVLKTLSDARLITTDDAVVEVAHEALIREWPTLLGWLTEDREGLRVHRRLTEDAQEWALMDRDPSELYRGPRLAQALEWAQFSRQAGDLNALEREFVEASRAFAEREAAEREARHQNELLTARALAEAQRQQAEEQRQRAEVQAGRAAEQAQAASRLRGRNRVITAIGALALLAALAAGFLGLQSSRNAGVAQAASTEAIAQRDEAQRQFQFARANQLAGQALSVVNSDLSLALLLGAEALRAADTDQARATMLFILKTSPHLLSFLRGSEVGLSSLAYSPDGNILATAGLDGTLRLWDVQTRLPAGPPVKLPSLFSPAIAFSPDSKRLAVGGEDGTLRLLDAATLQPAGQPLGDQTAHVYTVAFSPDGATLASASSDKTIRLWQVATGQPLTLPLTGHSQIVNMVAFSPDGKLLASGSSDASIRLWDAATGRPVGQPLMGHSDAVTSLAFSPDGKLLASGSRDRDVRVWDLSAAAPSSVRFVGHTDSVTSVAFSPDGRLLLSAGTDDTLRLWKVASGVQLGPALAGHLADVSAVAFHPDGQTMASASLDHTVAIWRAADDVVFLSSQGWLVRVCAIAGRSLTQAEWDKYLPGEPYHTTCDTAPSFAGSDAAAVPAASVHFAAVSALATGPDGSLYLAFAAQTSPASQASCATQIGRIDPAGLFTIVAGRATAGFADGPPLEAQFNCVAALAIDRTGNLFVADSGNHRVRVVDRVGIVTTVAGVGRVGQGLGGFTGDGGLAVSAELGNPASLAFDAIGNLFIAQTNRVLKMDSQGIIRAFAGTGLTGNSGDGGPALDATFSGPLAVVVEQNGNVDIADAGSSRIRFVDSDGIIHNLAGTGERGFSGEGGPATEAQLSGPFALAYDGSLQIVDSGNSRVRIIDGDGNIFTTMGTGEPGFSGDGGQAVSARLNHPSSLAFDDVLFTRFYIYVADGDGRIRRVDGNGIITTIAGGAP